MSVLLLAFALIYLAMILLCLNLPRHRGVLLRGDIRLPDRKLMWLLASSLFGIALWLCINNQGGEIGTVLWLCLVMLAGVLLVLILAWRSRWVLPVASLLLLCGGLQGLL